MKKALYVSIIFICIIFFTPVISHTKTYIDIDSPSFQRFPIAITYFKDIKGEGSNKDISKEIFEVLSQDLEFSGLFSIMDPTLFIESPVNSNPGKDNKINFGDWSVIGAEVLLKGSFRFDNNRLEIEARLYDVFQRQFLLGKRYVGNRQDLRKMMHLFCNEILLSFTGEDGIFDTKIAFASDKSGHKEIYFVDFDGHNMVKVTNHKSIALSPAWSPDGKMIAFTSYKYGNPDLYIKDLVNNKENIVSRFKGLNIAPAWSPKGEKLAATLSLDGNPEIYVLDKDGRIIKRLTNNWGIDVSPTWSPDGKEIAFVSNRAGKPNIYTMNSQGDNVKRLTFQTNYNVSPKLSPKGNRIAFSSMEGGLFNIYTMNPDGTDVKRLTTNSGDNEYPSWSPNGRFLTFISTRSGNKRIYIMRADGSGQRPIRVSKGNQLNPCWSPRIH
ncbi:MAG: Tol-Pal system beta propeller repeat protein TolB [Pseudomonadota bacterium]